MNFVDMIAYFGRSQPEKLAIVMSDRMVSYRMLAAGIASVERALLEAGVTQKDLVAVTVVNPVRHLIVVSALFRLGIVSVSLAEVTGYLRVSAEVTDGDPPAGFNRRIIRVEDDWFGRAPLSDAERPPGFRDEDALARVIMSSGTTAAPKSIGMSSRVIEDRILTGRRTLALAPWDRMLCMPSLSSSLGFGSALQALAYGHTLAFAQTPLEALEMICAYGLDLVVANPAFLRKMVAEHEARPIPTASLKLIKYGGAALGADFVATLRARLCKDVMCVYSSTESGPIAYGHINEILQEPYSTGFVAPWIDVEILGPDQAKLPPGREGRVRVRSRWQAYDMAHGPQAARDWMYTGDIGKITESGMLALVGRFDDAIPHGDRFIAPERIEEALLSLPGVADAAVVALPDASGEVKLRAVLVAGRPIALEELNSFTLSRDGAWRIADIAFVEEIARNDMGKIMRRKVKELLAAKP